MFFLDDEYSISWASRSVQNIWKWMRLRLENTVM